VSCELPTSLFKLRRDKTAGQERGWQGTETEEKRKEERANSKGQGSGANAAFTWNKKSDLLSLFLAMPVIKLILKPKLSDFLLDLHRSLAHQGFAKILDISTGMPAVFANPYASRSQHISSQKIAQLR